MNETVLPAAAFEILV